MIRKVLGPPGTGKTTTLLNYVKNYLDQGIAPSRIGYFALQKKLHHMLKRK
jgi:predicted NACHT family NTPase